MLCGNRDGRRGQAVTEFALVLPLSLVLILGLVVFGIALTRLESVENAASEGGRAAQRWRPFGGETCIQAVNNAVARSTPFATSVLITGACPNDTTTRIPARSLITVQVSYTYHPIFFGTLFKDIWEPPSTWILDAEVTVMHE